MTYDEMHNILMSIDDPVLKLETVMDFGSHLSDVPVTAICSEIHGCASHVEICRDGTHFYGRADSALVRGIVAIVIAMVDGKTPAEIRSMGIIQRFAALNINLGAGRINGLNSIVRFLENL